MIVSEIQRLVTKPPRVTKSTLDAKSRTVSFVIPNGMFYDYYSLKVSKEPTGSSGLFHRIEKLPPVLADGLVIFNKKIYAVSRKDLLRRRINVSTEYHVPVHQPIAETTVEPVVEQPVTHNPAGFEVLEDANMAWDEQVRSLLYAHDPEAWYWETESATQPGRDDEDGPVPDFE